MQMLPTYIQLGFQHISDLAGYDHILFLVALCAVYRIERWKHILILVTAFTLGHSVTLALAAFGTVIIPSRIVEFLIPVTILITALHNVISKQAGDPNRKMSGNYLMALFFGFIHGMGFSNYFRALVMGDESIVLPLLGFNLGIELGQLLVVTIVVGVAFLCVNIVGVKHREWNVFVSGAAAGMSLILMSNNPIW